MKLTNNLYVQILATAREWVKKYGFDMSLAKDIAHDTCIIMIEKLQNEEECKKIKNPRAFVYGIISHKLNDLYKSKRKQSLGEAEFDYITDKIDESHDLILNNQAKHFSSLIDDYLSQHPSAFTKQNIKLWKIFKHQQYSVKEMMEIMGITSRNTFDVAKKRLVDCIIDIYNKMVNANLI